MEPKKKRKAKKNIIIGIALILAGLVWAVIHGLQATGIIG